MSITSETRKAIIDALNLGMPLGNAADLVMLPLERIQRELRDNEEFQSLVNQAIAQCMESRLKKLKDLQNWQALAFILESIWPTRFGRHSRRGKRRIKKATAQGDLDFNYLSPQEQQHLDYLLAKAHGRTGQGRNGRGVSVEDGAEPKLLH